MSALGGLATMVKQFQNDCECYTRDYEVCVRCGHSFFCRIGDCNHGGLSSMLAEYLIQEDEDDLSVEEIIFGDRE